MMTKPCRFVTLAVATIHAPAAREGTFPAMTHVSALATLIAERDEDGVWNFAVEHHAIAAGTSEDALLAWATQTLPETGTVVGWHLADDIVAPLLEAGTIGDPEIGRRFLDGLMKLVTIPSIDLAIQHGGASARGLSVVCGANGIALSALTAAEIESAWAFGDLSRLRAHAMREVVAVWQLFLSDANGKAAVASDAFATWLVTQYLDPGRF